MFSPFKETTVLYLSPTMTRWNSARWARKVLSFLIRTQQCSPHPDKGWTLANLLFPHLLWNKFYLVWRRFKKNAFWWHVYKHSRRFEWAIILMVGAILRCFVPAVEKSTTACTDNSSWTRCLWETFWSMLTLQTSVKISITSSYVENRQNIASSWL